MQLKKGATVVTADGRKVGTVDRVVIDPRSKQVTHFVVHKGILFTEDKIVKLDQVADASEDHITLREGVDQQESLPRFEETYYIAADRDSHAPAVQADKAIPLYQYGPVVGEIPGAGVYPEPLMQPTPATVTDTNIPDGTIALKEGARVVSADQDTVGTVERVLTDPGSNRVSYFVITHSGLTKTAKIVPMSWVDQITESEVRLSVGSQTLAQLRPYHE